MLEPSKEEARTIIPAHRPFRRGYPAPITQFHWQGGLHVEDALPGRHDPRGTEVKRIANTGVRSPAERHIAMSWAQRLKRVFNIDTAVCGRCGGSVRVIACIEDQDIIDRILAHLESKEQNTPALPHLAPPTRAPPKSLPLFAGKKSRSTALNQQGSH